MIARFKTFFRYIFIGAVASLVDYSSYFFFARSLGVGPYWANFFSYLCGNIVSFFGHHLFTFRVPDFSRVFREYVKFAIVTIAGLLLSEAVIYITLKLGFSDIFGKAAAVIGSGLFNFTVNSVWTFHHERQKL